MKIYGLSTGDYEDVNEFNKDVNNLYAEGKITEADLDEAQRVVKLSLTPGMDTEKIQAQHKKIKRKAPEVKTRIPNIVNLALDEDGRVLYVTKKDGKMRVTYDRHVQAGRS